MNTTSLPISAAAPADDASDRNTTNLPVSAAALLVFTTRGWD